METGNIKINGEAITVIFTGEKYYFHSNLLGSCGNRYARKRYKRAQAQEVQFDSRTQECVSL